MKGSESRLLKISNGQVITPNGILGNATIVVKSGIVDTITQGNIELPGATELNANGNFVAPGLIDIQINGFLGVDFSDQNLSAEDLRKATKALLQNGVTTFLPTIITNDFENLKRSFSILTRILDDEELSLSVPGFHLEGPYISPVQGYRGAHLEKYVRLPNWSEFAELQEAANNRIKLITVAPEVEGAIPFIRKCVESGVVVALGHHNGSSDLIHQAVDAGASLSTHLGNGCANLINRHENPLWPQLADSRLSATIIADGFHLNKDQLQCFYKMKDVGKTILVSDALDLAGLPPGEYIRMERVVVLSEVVRYPAENVLAGAASPLSSCVLNMMKYTNCGLENAIKMSASNPAELLGLRDIGVIDAGKRANLMLFTLENERMELQNTILDGRVVYSRNQ